MTPSKDLPQMDIVEWASQMKNLLDSAPKLDIGNGGLVEMKIYQGEPRIRIRTGYSGPAVLLTVEQAQMLKTWLSQAITDKVKKGAS